MQEAAERAGGVEGVDEQLLPARSDVERADRHEVRVPRGAEHPRGRRGLLGARGAGGSHEPEQRDGLPGAEPGAVQRAVRRLGHHLPGRLEDRGHRERLAAGEPQQRLLPAGDVPARAAGRLEPVRPRAAAAVGRQHRASPAAAAAAAADAVEDGEDQYHGEDREEDGVDDCLAHCSVQFNPGSGKALDRGERGRKAACLTALGAMGWAGMERGGRVWSFGERGSRRRGLLVRACLGLALELCSCFPLLWAASAILAVGMEERETLACDYSRFVSFRGRFFWRGKFACEK